MKFSRKESNLDKSCSLVLKEFREKFQNAQIEGVYEDGNIAEQFFLGSTDMQKFDTESIDDEKSNQ